MYSPEKKAFTLTELLVVVIVLGVLSAVAVPKFTRILETRKTAEAESFLEAVRTEQEKRCVFGKDYLGQLDKVHVATTAPRSGQYSYRLLKKGMAAQSRSKDYTLRVPSYKDGRLCCEGPYCSKLNKDYPLCAQLTNLSYDDECSADVEESCIDNARQAKCCSATQKWDGGKCVAKTYCELHPDECTCNPYQAKCCTGTQKWEGRQCVNKTFCELNPDDCTCNPDQQKCCNSATEKWDGSKCVAQTFCELHPDDCTCNPDQQKCCNKDTQKWDGSSCVALTECDKNPNQCACAPYAAAHAEECDENSCLNKPDQEKCCDTSTQKWDGASCIPLTECELNPNQEQCCDAETEKWDGTTCVPLTECELNPNQEACCDPATEKWDGTTCVPLTECELNPNQEACCDPATEKWDGTTCVPLTECEINPDQEACCDAATEKWDGTECVALSECEMNPNQEQCCDAETEKWDGTTCVAKTECDYHPTSCTCETYAAQHYEECDPNSCTQNPNQEKCCTGGREWNGSTCECPNGQEEQPDGTCSAAEKYVSESVVMAAVESGCPRAGQGSISVCVEGVTWDTGVFTALELTRCSERSGSECSTQNQIFLHNNDSNYPDNAKGSAMCVGGTMSLPMCSSVAAGGDVNAACAARGYEGYLCVNYYFARGCTQVAANPCIRDGDYCRDFGGGVGDWKRLPTAHAAHVVRCVKE